MVLQGKLLTPTSSPSRLEIDGSGRTRYVVSAVAEQLKAGVWPLLDEGAPATLVAGKWLARKCVILSDRSVS